MALTDYKPFQTVKINSYTQLDIVPHSSIEAVAFEKCADPKETLGSYYSSKEKKPQIMINGGLFNMSTGHNVMSFVCDGKEQNYQNGFTGGVMQGDANGKFRPKAAVTREELAAVIARVLDKVE